MRSGETVSLHKKFSDLISLLRESGDAVLAFSGGVDSTFLLKAMKMAEIRVLAVTALSETMPDRDILSARSLSKELCAEHREIRTEELMNETFANNPPDRCFYCKDELFRKLRVIAGENGFRSVFDGTNADDLSDYRPGRKAAKLHGVRSPLAECGFSKIEIRQMSKELGLSTWDKPSSPCLSSRFPYGSRITAGALQRVAKAEEIVRSLGVKDLRVRDHGDTARIEVAEEDMPLLAKSENRHVIVSRLKALGYAFVSMDLEGYRSGGMNRVLDGEGTGRLSL